MRDYQSAWRKQVMGYAGLAALCLFIGAALMGFGVLALSSNPEPPTPTPAPVQVINNVRSQSDCTGICINVANDSQ